MAAQRGIHTVVSGSTGTTPGLAGRGTLAFVLALHSKGCIKLGG